MKNGSCALRADLKRLLRNEKDQVIKKSARQGIIVNIPAIRKHLKNIFYSGELKEDTVNYIIHYFYGSFYSKYRLHSDSAHFHYRKITSPIIS
ncbi:MAG: hypothetical protein PVH61_36160 [Candidatus Aminicenantes bacterium]|jgi:hypothetical protein